MRGKQLQSGRKQKGWNQEQAASRLGVSQPSLSLLEKGERRVPERLARKAASIYGLSAATLPVETTRDKVRSVDQEELALDLSALGYPGFAHLRRRHRKKNPADVLFTALSASNLDMRLIEALPWLLLTFPELDWQWLVTMTKIHDLQIRLGFITAIAHQIARSGGDTTIAALLGQLEKQLAESRLAREDTLCHDSLTDAERRWLRTHRPPAAKWWGLLADLIPEHLSYGD
jgi:transcriptional regulator with XRE-family HTH domain